MTTLTVTESVHTLAESQERAQSAVVLPQPTTRALEKKPVPPLKWGFAEVLPLELTSTIFAIACQTQPNDYLAGSHAARVVWTTPLRLGSICRCWRDIVFATPQLWSHIFLYFSFERSETQLSLLKAWLARSNPYPLTITLTFEEEQSWFKDPPLDLIRTLVSVAHRWSSINGTIPQSCRSVFDDVAPLPILSTISIHPFDPDDFPEDPPEDSELAVPTPPAFVGKAQNLTTLSLKGYLQNPDASSTPSWARLTSLTFQYLDAVEFRTILFQATNLIECYILASPNAVEGDSEKPILNRDIVLLRLEKLVLQCPWGHAEKILERVTTPNLDLLEMSMGHSQVDLSDLAGLIDDLRPPPRITLHQIVPLGRSLKFWSFFNRLPELEDVEISLPSCVDRSYYFARDLFMLPDDDDNPSYILPNLRRFVLKGPCKPSIRSYDTELLAGLERRWFYGITDPEVEAAMVKAAAENSELDSPIDRSNAAPSREIDTSLTLTQTQSAARIATLRAMIDIEKCDKFRRITDFVLVDTTGSPSHSRFDPPGLQMLHNLQARGMTIHVGAPDQSGPDVMGGTRLRAFRSVMKGDHD